MSLFSGLGGAPRPPNFMQAAEQQTLANRPNQNTAWGSTSWQQGPGGQWTQNQQLNPGLQGLFDSAIQNQQQGINYGALPQLTDGAAARDQAITGAYDQAKSRLDPRFQQGEDALRTRMYNQGLREGDAAFETQMGNFSRDKNDAYSSAMNGAIEQGTAAGNSMFQNSLAGRQQMLGEANQQMNQPLQGFGGLLGTSGSFSMPSYGQAGNYLGAAQAQWGADMQANQQNNSLLGGIMGGAGAIAGSMFGGPMGGMIGQRAGSALGGGMG